MMPKTVNSNEAQSPLELDFRLFPILLNVAFMEREE